MADSASATCKIDWLYPELLSKEGLVHILSQRFVKLPDNVEAASKEDLLEQYYKYILPRPQRQYRNNRRGRDMIRKQITLAKKRKSISSVSNEPSAKKVKNTSSQHLSSFDGISPGDRLKPPPSCINFKKKVIKLSSSKSSGECSSSPSTVNSLDGSPLAKKIRVDNFSLPSEEEVKKSSVTAEVSTMSKNIKPINSHLNNVTLKKEVAAPDTADSSKVTRQEAPKGSPMETSPESPDKCKSKFQLKKVSWP